MGCVLKFCNLSLSFTAKYFCMRKVLHLLISFTCALLLANSLYAQNDRFAYAITDLTKEGSGWNALRKLDLQTGAYSEVLLNGTDQKQLLFNATTKKQLIQQPDARYGNLLETPFTTGVAAAAYDKKHNRLYFTPMFVDQLRYIDLKTMKVYYVTDQAFTNFGHMQNDEGKIVTRMVIDPDGNGYAVTNDANNMIRFSTGKKLKIEQLGGLVDDPSNNGISIHNRCSSYGGDMICDNKGNLYIISARNHVFKVATKSKVALHLGMINGLSPNFTVNGAVVNADGNVLVSSAVDGTTYYVLDPKEWNATPFQATNGIYRSSDLANSNYLDDSRKKNALAKLPEALNQKQSRSRDLFFNQIAIYPNPVTDNRITIQFNKVPSGNYSVELRDVLGRSVLQQKITISSEAQTQGFLLNENNSRGVYMIKIFDVNSRSVFSQKVVVQ